MPVVTLHRHRHFHDESTQSWLPRPHRHSLLREHCRSECSDSRAHPSLQQLSVRHAALDGASQVEIHESEMSVPTFLRFKGEKP